MGFIRFGEFGAREELAEEDSGVLDEHERFIGAGGGGEEANEMVHVGVEVLDNIEGPRSGAAASVSITPGML